MTTSKPAPGQLIAGHVAIVAAITGGRVGFFRPDLSVNGATDLGLVATTLIGWLIIFDFPAGDYRTLRGAPLFPPIDGDERQAEDDASKSRLAASAGQL
jgi:hypothetical protein